MARILVVEDDGAVRAFVQRALSHGGHQVTTVVDGLAAVSALAAEPFDLLLTDIVMPGSMNGIELATRARLDFPTLPVVLMSGYSESMSDAERMGLEVLPKPTPPDVLAAVLDRIVRGRRTATAA